MNRLIPALLVAAVAAALHYRDRFQQSEEKADDLLTELLWVQDRQFALTEELDRWRETAQMQSQALAQQMTPEGIPAPSDGGLWIIREGMTRPFGPVGAEQVDATAESLAQGQPGQLTHVLASVASVTHTNHETHWDFSTGWNLNKEA